MKIKSNSLNVLKLRKEWRLKIFSFLFRTVSASNKLHSTNKILSKTAMISISMSPNLVHNRRRENINTNKSFWFIIFKKLK